MVSIGKIKLCQVECGVQREVVQPFQAWSPATLVTRPARPRTIRPPPPPRRRPRGPTGSPLPRAPQPPPRLRRRTGTTGPTGQQRTTGRTPTCRPRANPARPRARPRPPSCRSSTTSTPGRSTFPDLVSPRCFIHRFLSIGSDSRWSAF